MGSVAFDNIFRMMRRFEERWWCAKEVDPKPYASTPEETTPEELFTITNRTGRRLSDGELRRRLSELQARARVRVGVRVRVRVRLDDAHGHLREALQVLPPPWSPL